jgi:hypothetical protein
VILRSIMGDYRSLSGARVERDRHVRLIYIDESGKSNPRQETYTALAGVIINGDQDYQQLETHLKSLVRKHIPEEDRPGFVFHAMDIFHGSRYFQRDKWPREKRHSILEDLAKIPTKFHLTVIPGFVQRLPFMADFRQRVPSATDEWINHMIHIEAFINVARATDTWMRQNAPHEVAMLVAEKTGKVEAFLKLIHGAFSTETVDIYWENREIDRELRKNNKQLISHAAFKTRRIIDTIHFAAKGESALLQIADTCAFLLKRQLMQKQDSAGLFDLITPSLFPQATARNGAMRIRQMRPPVPVHIDLRKASGVPG